MIVRAHNAISTLHKQKRAKSHKLYKGRTKDVIALCTRWDFYTASFPHIESTWPGVFFASRALALVFFFSFCFTGVAFRVLRAEGRAAEGWRALARPRREVRERPRGPPRGRTLSRARHSLAAPGFRVAASGIGIQHPHTQQRRGSRASHASPRAKRERKEFS